jgi:hypothetical protein
VKVVETPHERALTRRQRLLNRRPIISAVAVVGVLLTPIPASSVPFRPPPILRLPRIFRPLPPIRIQTRVVLPPPSVVPTTTIRSVARPIYLAAIQRRGIQSFSLSNTLADYIARSNAPDDVSLAIGNWFVEQLKLDFHHEAGILVNEEGGRRSASEVAQALWRRHRKELAASACAIGADAALRGFQDGGVDDADREALRSKVLSEMKARATGGIEEFGPALAIAVRTVQMGEAVHRVSIVWSRGGPGFTSGDVSDALCKGVTQRL